VPGGQYGSRTLSALATLAAYYTSYYYTAYYFEPTTPATTWSYYTAYAGAVDPP
jgi:hypothetical protein